MSDERGRKETVITVTIMMIMITGRGARGNRGMIVTTKAWQG